MSVGLVLEGGGMRGLYTAGVLDAFLDADTATIPSTLIPASKNASRTPAV